MATSTLEVSLTNTGTNVKQTYTTIRFTSQKHTQKRRNPNSQNGDAINKKCGFDTHTHKRVDLGKTIGSFTSQIIR